MKGTHGQARKEHSELRLRRKQLRRTLEEIYSRDNLLMALTTSYSSKVLSEQEIELGSAGLCQIGRVAKIFADLTDRVVFLEGEYSDPGRTDREGLAAILDSMQTLLVCVDENRFLTDFIEKILGAWENQRGN